MEIARLSARGTLDVFIGNLVGAGFSAIGLVLLARLLGPVSFGLVAVVLVLPSIALLVQDFAISHAVTRFVAFYRTRDQDNRARNVIAAGGLFEAVSALVLTTIAFFSAQSFAAAILLKPDLTPLIRAASWMIVGDAMLTFSRAVLMGVDRLGRYAFVLAQNAALRGILPVMLVIIGFGLQGAVIGLTIGSVASGLAALLALFGQIPARSSRSTKENESLAKEFRTMSQYSLPLYFSFLAGGALPQFLTIVAAIFLTPWTLGNYSAAVRLGILAEFVSVPILTALFPAFSKVDSAKEKSNLESLYKYGIKYTAMAVVPLAALLILMSQPVVLLLYGVEYAEAGLYLGLIFIVFFYSAFGSLVVGSFLRGQGHTMVYLTMGLLLFLVGAPASLLLAPSLQATGLVLASLTANLLAYLVAVSWVAHHHGFQPDWRSSGKIVFSALISGLAGCIIFAVCPLYYWIRIGLAVVAFVVVYILSLGLTRTLTKRDSANLRALMRSLGVLSKPLLAVLRSVEVISCITERKNTRGSGKAPDEV